MRPYGLRLSSDDLGAPLRLGDRPLSTGVVAGKGVALSDHPLTRAMLAREG
ncbi:MAG: hypothetical protein RML75_00390 [Cyanobacteriota bacterium SKYGB_h_bin112]|nr:hypothetical protein [Cyanobacteriota bacterium SKYGB_h_bin112]